MARGLANRRVRPGDDDGRIVQEGGLENTIVPVLHHSELFLGFCRRQVHLFLYSNVYVGRSLCPSMGGGGGEERSGARVKDGDKKFLGNWCFLVVKFLVNWCFLVIIKRS